MNEPTAAQLKEEEDLLAELEADLNSELDDLLVESMVFAAKKKAAQGKRGKHESDLFPLTFGEGDNWRDVFSCAIFVETTCRCGCVAKHFSHFSTFQHFSGKIAGKPTRWVRLDSRPEILSPPRLFRRAVELCPNCYSTEYAVPYDTNCVCLQMNILDFIKN